MGLAVVQQLNGNIGFEHGMLASMFGDRAAGKEETSPRLRLVDVNKTDEFFNNPSNLEHIHVDFAALDELRNAARNIEDHAHHVLDTTFKYSVKELMKGDHDADITTDIGTIKTSNATQSGYTQQREKRRWADTMLMVLNNQRDEYLRRLEEQMRQIRERIKNIDKALDTLEGKTNDDFKGDSAEAQRLREQIDEDLAKLGKSRNDFLNENGDFDVQKAQEYLQEHKQQASQELEQLKEERKKLDQNESPEIAALRDADIAAQINAKSAKENEYSSNPTPLKMPLDSISSSALVTLANAPSNDSADDLFISADQVNIMALTAQNTSRPLGSVAGSLDGENKSVLSGEFTALAKGDTKQTPSQSPDIAPSAAPALRTLTA